MRKVAEAAKSANINIVLFERNKIGRREVIKPVKMVKRSESRTRNQTEKNPEEALEYYVFFVR